MSGLVPNRNEVRDTLGTVIRLCMFVVVGPIVWWIANHYDRSCIQNDMAVVCTKTRYRLGTFGISRIDDSISQTGRMVVRRGPPLSVDVERRCVRLTSYHFECFHTDDIMNLLNSILMNDEQSINYRRVKYAYIPRTVSIHNRL